MLWTNAVFEGDMRVSDLDHFLLPPAQELAGLAHASSLIASQSEIPEDWEGHRLVFLGAVWRGPHEAQLVLCLEKKDGRWQPVLLMPEDLLTQNDWLVCVIRLTLAQRQNLFGDGSAAGLPGGRREMVCAGDY
ncbi:MAG: hypothetical protein PHS62_03175 [Patescibacteria group bacterium]|nr:hypothetical protein [Patescibacteria group bacterium]